MVRKWKYPGTKAQILKKKFTKIIFLVRKFSNMEDYRFTGYTYIPPHSVEKQAEKHALFVLSNLWNSV